MIPEMDEAARQLAAWLVDSLNTLEENIKQPAMSVKLTKAEQWERIRADYPAMRQDMATWQQIMDSLGPEQTAKLGRHWESLMLEGGYASIP